MVTKALPVRTRSFDTLADACDFFFDVIDCGYRASLSIDRLRELYEVRYKFDQH